MFVLEMKFPWFSSIFIFVEEAGRKRFMDIFLHILLSSLYEFVIMFSIIDYIIHRKDSGTFLADLSVILDSLPEISARMTFEFGKGSNTKGNGI